MSLIRINELALEGALRVQLRQPRGDRTIFQLPPQAAVLPSDLIAIFRAGDPQGDGFTYRVPVSAIPTSAINPPYYYNVKSYGAYGDGIHDDTAAIMAAELAAETTGGTVFFPPGSYLVSATILIATSGIRWLGCGPGSSTIIMAPTVVSPSIISASNVNGIEIEEMAFIGNSVAPPNDTANAPTALVFRSGYGIRVVNCYFQGMTGDVIDFLGIDGAIVFGCRFSSTGYSGFGTTPSLATPAVFSDSASTAIIVNANHFYHTQYFSIQHLGTNCEASFNYHKGCGIAAIRVGYVGSQNLGNGARITFNTVDTVYRNSVDSLGGVGIYFEGATNWVAQGNVISLTDSDGFVQAACWQYSVLGNIAFNCCQLGGQCGFQDNPHAGAVSNDGGTWIGNVAYDNQTTPTMTCGMRVIGPGATVRYTTIVGNSFNGFTGTVASLPQRGIAMTDGILDDDTNNIRSNAGAWLDYQHLGTPVTIPAGTTVTGVGAPSSSVVDTYTIVRGQMGLRRGLRIVAFGKTTGTTTNLIFYMTYGTSLGNMLQETVAAVDQAEWKIELEMYESGTNNDQVVSYNFYYNGALVTAAAPTSLHVDSTQDQDIVLQVQTDTSDTVIAQAFTVVRQ